MAYRGKSLRALRESKGIRLRRIANETRISLSYLEDLESERFDRFPGDFYFHSFVKAYATAVGLDPAEVLEDLKIGYAQWQGNCSTDPTEPIDRLDEGWLHRIAGYIRSEQEV